MSNDNVHTCRVIYVNDDLMKYGLPSKALTTIMDYENVNNPIFVNTKRAMDKYTNASISLCRRMVYVNVTYMDIFEILENNLLFIYLCNSVDENLLQILQYVEQSTQYMLQFKGYLGNSSYSVPLFEQTFKNYWLYINWSDVINTQQQLLIFVEYPTVSAKKNTSVFKSTLMELYNNRGTVNWSALMDNNRLEYYINQCLTEESFLRSFGQSNYYLPKYLSEPNVPYLRNMFNKIDFFQHEYYLLLFKQQNKEAYVVPTLEHRTNSEHPYRILSTVPIDSISISNTVWSIPLSPLPTIPNSYPRLPQFIFTYRAQPAIRLTL